MTPDEARAVLEAHDRFTRIDPEALGDYNAGELAHGLMWLKDLLPSARAVIFDTSDTVDELANVRGLAARFGVNQVTVHNWSNLPDFPAPAEHRPPRHGGRRWRVGDVDEWFSKVVEAIADRDRRIDAELDASDEGIAQRRRERHRLAGELAALADSGATRSEAAEQLGITRGLGRRIAAQFHISFRKGTRARFDDDQLIAALTEASETTNPLTVTAYELWRLSQQTPVPSATVITRRLGGGSWVDALAATGIEPDTAQRRKAIKEHRFSDKELLSVVARFSTTGDLDFHRRATNEALPSSRTVIDRFGSWTEARRQATR